MDLVLKSEVLQCREDLAERIGNLCRGRYLPVEVPASNTYTKGKRVGLTERHQQTNELALEPDYGIVEPEVLRRVHKLRETLNGKRELPEELNSQVFEARGRDPTNNRFQKSANALELEQAKIGKCNVCRDWRM